MADPQDSVKTRLGIVEEVTWGTTPASALQLINLSEFPAFTRPRNVGRPDVVGSANPRRGYPSRALQEDGNLTLNSNLQYGNMPILWEGALMNDLGTATALDETTIDATASSGVIDDSGNGFTNLAVGDMVYIAGTAWTGAGNTAGWHGPLSAAAAGSITVPAAQVGFDVSAGTQVIVKSQRLADGDTPRSFSCEWEALDLTTDLRAGTGYKVQSHTFSWATGGFATESCTLIGQAPEHGTATIGTGGPTASSTNAFMDCVSDFGTIYIAETATTYIVASWELVINIELGPYYGIGNKGPSSISEARILPTLNARVIYDDDSKELLDNIEDLTTVASFWDVVSADGDRVCWSMPAAKPETGDPTGGGPGVPLEIANLSLAAHDPAKDSTSAYVSAGLDYQLGMFVAVV